MNGNVRHAQPNTLRRLLSGRTNCVRYRTDDNGDLETLEAPVRTDCGYAFAGTVVPFPRAAGDADAWIVKIDSE